MPLWVFFLMILTFSSGSHCSSSSPTLRMPRYAYSVFTDTLREMLSNISVHKHLQDISSRQRGKRNQEQGAKARLDHQMDSMWEDQKHLSLESILVALLRKHSRNSRG